MILNISFNVTILQKYYLDTYVIMRKIMTSMTMDVVHPVFLVLRTSQINFHTVDVNKYRYIQTPIGLFIFRGNWSCLYWAVWSTVFFCEQVTDPPLYNIASALHVAYH